ncbi:MAG: anti-sigma factor [bacterium]
MNCEDVGRLLQDYAARELAPEARRAVDEHLAGCEECREELALLALVVAGLDRQPVLEPAPGFSARVMAGLPAQQRVLHPAWALALLPVLAGLAWLFRAPLSGPVLRLAAALFERLPDPGAGAGELGRVLTAQPLLVAGAGLVLGLGAVAGAAWYCWASYFAE